MDSLSDGRRTAVIEGLEVVRAGTGPGVGAGVRVGMGPRLAAPPHHQLAQDGQQRVPQRGPPAGLAPSTRLHLQLLIVLLMVHADVHVRRVGAVRVAARALLAAAMSLALAAAAARAVLAAQVQDLQLQGGHGAGGRMGPPGARLR